MLKEKFSLKDHLFNAKKIVYISNRIKDIYPEFSENQFQKNIIEKFPELELKERIFWIRENLKIFLPNNFEKAVIILLQSLPDPLDPENSDDDFGDFIFAPFSDFVAKYGCDKKNLEFSLDSLERMTQNFSAEDSIRFFLNTFPEKTLEKIKKWSVSENYHVRRLASEGTRPSLPWSQKVSLDLFWVIKNILENLYNDSTRYVVRSVANHMNDISKKDSELVLSTLVRWKKNRKFRSEAERDFLISHSLRTLVKKGNTDALALLGYNSNPEILLKNFSITTPEIFLGEQIHFSFEIISTAKKNENMMIDYLVYFLGKNGKLLPPKTFKIKKIVLKKGKKIFLEKKHRFRTMTTKKLYSGMHRIELQINGKVLQGGEFFLNY